MIHITYNKEEAAVMNTTQLTINNISAELTGRVHIIVNRVFKGEKAVKNQVRVFTTIDELDKRLDVIALACEVYNG